MAISEYLTAGPSRVVRASSLQREYRSVLDDAHERLVQILDRDNTVLGVGRWEEIQFDREVVVLLREVTQFKKAFAAHRDDDTFNWVQMTAFPWLAGLADRDAVREFEAELLPFLLQSVAVGDLSTFWGNLRAWESTAETSSIPEMAAAMEIDIAGEHLIELFGPDPEDIARDAQGD